MIRATAQLYGEKWKVLVTPSCLTLCNSMDWNPQGFSVHGILQARILERVALPFSRGFSQLRDDRTQVSCIGGRLFTIWTTREAQLYGTFWCKLAKVPVWNNTTSQEMVWQVILGWISFSCSWSGSSGLQFQWYFHLLFWEHFWMGKFVFKWWSEIIQ